MKEEILSIASDLREGSMTTNEAKEQLLRLFDTKSEKCFCTTSFHKVNHDCLAGCYYADKNNLKCAPKRN